MRGAASPAVALSVTLDHRQGDFRLAARFEAAAGVTALFGPSGAGKSSIVAAVAGLLRPDEGRIVLNGRTLTDMAAGIFVSPHQRRAGLVFQDGRLFPHMTVRKNLLYGWRRAPVQADAADISHVVALLGLDGLLQRWPSTLSGGEKARLALGRALLASPQILLLDEPLASLDDARRAEILPYLERLRDEARVPMLYVSHAVDEVARLADQVVLLGEGQVQAQGPVGQVLPGRSGVGGVIDAIVGVRRGDGLVELGFKGGRLAVATTAKAGTRLRVRLSADDILIARVAPEAISANNILPVTIQALRTAGDVADVELQAGAVRLLARITAASAQRLGLAPGLAVFAVIKSVTLDLPSGDLPFGELPSGGLPAPGASG
jgi:molybdate transport system ATP-binding protein